MQNTGELPGNINHLSSLAEYSEQIIFSFDVSTATFLYLNPAAKHIFEISLMKMSLLSSLKEFIRKMWVTCQ